MATKHFKYANEEIKLAVKNLFVSGEPGANVRINHACLIGFDWLKFSRLNKDASISINKQFLDHFVKAMPKWVSLLDEKFESFEHKSLRFDVFFIPFPSVVDFRNEFNKVLD
ncbi:Hachiman antiphage defense system protein HamA [Pectobacterium polaris]|uniref:Hachiman antiphage defense system protein HamA n=1 Tax=Pectobacterium polaris TaxID=2042057 RepID=UPI00269A0B34